MSEVESRKSKALRAELETAAREQARLRLSRSIRGSDKVDGFVVGLGQAWVLVAVLDPNMYLNGFAALRLADVKRVERRGGPDSFAGKALAARGEWPPHGADVNLDDLAELIRSAAAVAPLVTLHIEAADPDVCFIGRPVGFTRRWVHLLQISPEAEWDVEPARWEFTEVTRVDFGGRYEEALSRVGGPPPD
jgi:hypothetical protein